MKPTTALTVSGVIPDSLDVDIAAGRRPRSDYRELAAVLGADIVARPATRSRSRRLLVRAIGENAAMAIRLWHRKDRTVLTDGEQVGLPFAMLRTLTPRSRRGRHVMIVHIMSVPKKARLFRLLRLGRGIDAYIVYATAQRDYLVDELGIDEDRVHVLPFMVDTAFFRPVEGVRPDRPLLVTAGLECRDYPTFLTAVDGLPVDVTIAAASFWSKRDSGLDGTAVPEHVQIASFDLAALRDLYGRAALVVMPLQPVEFQAGITTILEAMAMGKPIVCTRTPGQTDTLVDGVTGVYVPPMDAPTLRQTVLDLLDQPDRAASLGRAAREWSVEHADIERYVASVAAIVQDSGSASSAG